MAESIQKILKRRAFERQRPTATDEIIAWLDVNARGWNRQPTPFVRCGSAPQVDAGPNNTPPALGCMVLRANEVG